MDATSNTLSVKIAGRDCTMGRPTESQILAIRMMGNNKLDDGVQLDVVTSLMLSLFSDAEEKAWLVMQMAMNEYSLDDMVATLKRLSTVPGEDGEPVAPRKVAKKTAKKAVARKPRTA